MIEFVKDDVWILSELKVARDRSDATLSEALAKTDWCSPIISLISEFALRSTRIVQMLQACEAFSDERDPSKKGREIQGE